MHDQSPDAGGEDAALRLEVEHPLVVGHDCGIDAPDLGRIAAQVRALAARERRRAEVQLVVRRAVAMLDVDRRVLPLQRVQPADALGKHRAVRLDRLPVAALEAVAGVVPAQKRLGDIAGGVQYERRDLLEVDAGVQLRAQP